MADDPLARLLGNLDRPTAPSPAFAAALWDRLEAELRLEQPNANERLADSRPAARLSIVALPVAPSGRPIPFRSGRARRMAAFANIAATLLVMLGTLAVALVARPSSRVAAPASPTPPFDLYASTGDAGGSYLALDQASLADLPGRPPLSLAPVRETDRRLVSTDGSTQVAEEPTVISGRKTVRFTSRDVRTGSVRATWEISGSWAATLHLSDDGGRLVVGIDALLRLDPNAGLHVGWNVFDTASGRLLSSVQASFGETYRVWMDPAARRLYRLSAPRTLAAKTSNEWPALTVHDLATGAEIGRVDLPGLAAGIWDVPGTFGVERSPGAVFTADGRRLIIAHADRDAVTIVDTERLTVERTVELTRPRGTLDRALAWLGLAPLEAAAKSIDGTAVDAALSPDGRHLYLTRYETILDHGGQTPTLGDSLQAVELARGEIVAEVQLGTHLDSLTVAPNGESLYAVTHPATDAPAPAETTIRRLDAATLAPLAERRFPDRRELLLITAPPTGAA